MSGLIDIETEELRRQAATLEQANNSIVTAVEKLTAITQHYDWNCPERDIINEYIEENAAQVKRIQDKSANFLTAIRQTTDEFAAQEEQISTMFERLEDLLRSMGTLGVLQKDTNFTKTVTDTVSSILNKSNTTCHGYGVLTDITMWKVSDISL